MTDTLDSEPEPTEGPNLRQLREKANRSDELEGRLAAYQRRDAVSEAGVDITTPQGKFFSEHYSGETTPDAVKEAAEAAGVPMVGQTAEEPGAEELPDTGTEVRQLLTGSPPHAGGVESPDPKQVALENFRKEMDAGATEDDASAVFIATLSDAAHRGDPRVIWEPTTPAQRG